MQYKIQLKLKQFLGGFEGCNTVETDQWILVDVNRNSCGQSSRLLTNRVHIVYV